MRRMKAPGGCRSARVDLLAAALSLWAAVGGAAARDLMLQRVPAVFGGNALYATVAVLAHRPGLPATAWGMA